MEPRRQESVKKPMRHINTYRDVVSSCYHIMSRESSAEEALRGSDRPPLEFSQQLREYLKELDWPQSKLAQRAGISDAQLSRWVASRDRSLGRHHVCRLAAALASGFLEKPKCEVRVEFFDKVLNDLLFAAGYSAITGRVQDRIWPRLTGESPRPLRVGWIEYPPFCESPGGMSTTVQDEPVGLAADITKLLADLAGLQVRFIVCEWKTIIHDLYTERIDLICPFLIKLPLRAVAFSAEIPGLSLGLNGLYPQKIAAEVRAAIALEEPAREWSIVVDAIAGDVGQSLRRIVLPGAKEGEAHDSLEAAARKLLDEPLEGGRRYRCLVADQAICVHLQNEHLGSFVLIKDDLANPPVKLPIAFAAHPEERQLISLVDQCIELMTRNDFIRPLIRRSRPGLTDYGVIVEEELF
jgi:transcriptional regulator with XRE-family HTH domain